MYLGMVAIVAGVALLEGSISPWIIVVVFAILLDRVFVAPEEKMLKATFGDAYGQCCQRVRRWL